MMYLVQKIIRNRNTILVMAVVAGMLFGNLAEPLEPYTIWVLALVMLVSTTGISFKSLVPFSNTLKIFGAGILFNYVVFSAMAILLAWLLFPVGPYFMGFVVIAFSPPGIAVIPFSQILHGNSNYTILATLGSYIAAVLILPWVFDLFPTESSLQRTDILIFLTKIIVVPLILSRLLLIKPIKPYVEKSRGRITDWGFAFIIFVAVGLNRHVFYEFSDVLFKSILLLFALTFVLGYIYDKLNRKFHWVDAKTEVSQNLLLTIKSSGFTATTSLALFGKEAAIPSAVMAIMVLVYLIYLSLK
ncbi:bile acid:sodium symporter family protein [Salinivirga cyanobacteriivorans]|nr:hypothetical protein [Salinivirga cyanobacteriivorans]